jgi:urease accessory protein
MGSDETPDEGHGSGHTHGAEVAHGDHGHGHSHGVVDATPLMRSPTGPSAENDGIVYFQAPDGRVLHSHDGLKPHSHDPIPNPGTFTNRRPRIENRDYQERAFTIGIGGPVGTGKTALMLSLCRRLRDDFSVAAITNDIFTREDGEYLIKHDALRNPDMIRAVETGGCPHAAIREDISCNLTEAESLTNDYHPDFILLESGGDNLAANFSRELADFIIYVIDVCGGDKIPRKGGPGVTQADLLVINKIELAEAVGASLEVMARDARKQRNRGPFVMANVKKNDGVGEIAAHILAAWKDATGGTPEAKRPKT